MIIDEDIVAGGVTPFIITKLIERHERATEIPIVTRLLYGRPPHFKPQKKR